MKQKDIIIPTVLFIAVFCVSFFCQRYSLIFRENIGLFLFTPDWLRETFSNPLPLSHFLGNFIGQFYAETVLGPMIPALMVLIIYLCISGLLKNCGVPFHRIAALAGTLAVWCLTSPLSTSVAISATLLISIALWLISLVFPIKWKRQSPAALWEMAVAAVLIAGASVFISQRKLTKENEEMAKVAIYADRGNWNEILKIATPEKVIERPLLLPYAMLALNGQTKLSEGMFRYPVTGVECLDLGSQNNAVGDLFQSYLFETLGVPNEAIHQMFQFSTNFDHGMTHLSLRRLIRLNVSAGNYRMAVKYAEILRHNLYYGYQARRIVKKYGAMDDLRDSTAVHSSDAQVLSYDPTTDILQLVKSGKVSSVVIDRLLAYFLLERNLDDFLTIFYSYDWSRMRIPTHYQEALLISGDIRPGIRIDPALSQGTYWKYYHSKKL